MGIFAAASIKTQTRAAGSRTGPELKAHQPESPAQFQPLPPALAGGLVAAPELEAAMDQLWARLQGPHSGPGGQTQQAFALAHWEPDEGATTIAAALAMRAAQLDPTCTFCLADFDFFNPGLSLLTALEADAGLSNVLCGQMPLESVLVGTRLPNLFVVPAGYPNVGRRIAQLHDRCRELCEHLLARFNYVLFDMPCLRDYPSFGLWASGLASSVLVVRAGQARRPVVAKAIRTLELMRLEVRGVALNAREYHVPTWLYTRT